MIAPSFSAVLEPVLMITPPDSVLLVWWRHSSTFMTGTLCTEISRYIHASVCECVCVWGGGGAGAGGQCVLVDFGVPQDLYITVWSIFTPKGP